MPTTSPLWRSVLFVPGARPDRFAKALASGADVVVFDLEDSVAADRKDQARDDVTAYVAAAESSRTQKLIRVNAPGSAWLALDLAAVRGLTGLDGIVVPKTEHAEAIEHAAMASGDLAIVPILETSLGILHAAAIAHAQATVPALLFGAEDLTAEIGVPRTIDGDELIYPRAQVVLAATAAGASAVDAVYIDITDLDGLRRDATRARAMGFAGKMAIHPSQIPVIHDVFSPTTDDVARARKLVDAFDAAAAAGGDAVVAIDRQMVDAPVVNRARRVLAMADAIAKR